MNGVGDADAERRGRGMLDGLDLGGDGGDGLSLISPPSGSGTSAMTRPASTATWPPPISASRATAAAISAGPEASRAPTTMQLCASWATVEAIAPRLSPNPCT